MSGALDRHRHAACGWRCGWTGSGCRVGRSLLAVMPAATAAQYVKLYPTQASLQEVSGVLSNPSLVALNGPLFRVSLGALTAWKIGGTEFVLVALMSMLHRRPAHPYRGGDRPAGAGRRRVSSAAHAPLTAALLTAGLANLAAAVLIALGLIGVGLPAAGSLAFGLAVGLTGIAVRRRRRRSRRSSPKARGRPPASPSPSSAPPTCCAPSATPDRSG